VHQNTKRINFLGYSVILTTNFFKIFDGKKEIIR